jgi:hypothetical protein
MSIVSTNPRTANILTLSYEAAVSLASLQYCAVIASGAATGRMKVTVPGGQGAFCVGILQTYNCAAGAQAEVMVEGVSQAVADSTFNSGVELCASGADGKLEAASAADYVIAIAEEAATEANQIVSVRIVSPYQKNA